MDIPEASGHEKGEEGAQGGGGAFWDVASMLTFVSVRAPAPSDRAARARKHDWNKRIEEQGVGAVTTEGGGRKGWREEGGTGARERMEVDIKSF